MFNKRGILIIKMLMHNKILTIKGLSKILEVSERTIRYDIDKVNNTLKQNNLKTITKKTGKGVFFNLGIKDRDALNLVINDISNYNYIMSRNERITYIIFLLLKTDKFITIESIADTISVSRSTIIKDLNKVKEWVEYNNIIFVSKQAHGIIIKTKERDIRKAIIKLFREQDCKHELFEFLNRNDLLSSENFISKDTFGKETFGKETFNIKNKSIIENCILKAEKKLDCTFCDDSFDSLLINIIIQIIRIKAGKNIKIEKYSLLSLKNKKEYLVASYISTIIERKYNIKISEEEIGYITIHLLSSNVIGLKNTDRENWIQIRIYVGNLIESFEKISKTNFNNDSQLFNGLLQHLRPMISRIKHDIMLKNPLLNDIKKSFNQVFNQTRLSVIFLEKEFNKKFSEDEIGYISIYFQTAIEKKLKSKNYSKNLLIICDTGLGTAIFVENKINDLFDIKIINTTSGRHYKEFLKNENDDTYKVDLIVSTIKINEKKIKTVYVNPILSEKNIFDLSKYLPIRNTNRTEKIKPRSTEVANNDNKPGLIELLSKDVILLNQYANDWQNAVRIGGNLLYKNDIVEKNYIDEMIRTINEMGPYVAILPGIAMPHAKPEKGSIKIGISLLTLKNGVNFGNNENDPIRIIISIAAIDGTTHMKVLKQLMNVIENKDFYSFIVNTDSKEEVINFIKQCTLKHS